MLNKQALKQGSRILSFTINRSKPFTKFFSSLQSITSNSELFYVPKEYFTTQRIELRTEGQQEIEKVLESIRFDDGTNLLSSGQIVKVEVQEGGKVVIVLKLDQDYRKIRSLIETSLKEISWVRAFEIRMAPKSQETKVEYKNNLKHIKKIIAVSSCKGGVGKSTVAVNLAFSLHKLGRKVGIFDADIYGPSLPTLLAKEGHTYSAHEKRPKEVLPIDFEGVKVMSFGFGNKERKAVMRGPMASNVVTQLVNSTIWGSLDYLVVDMPPGTGDIQITLCQELKIAAAVIVTTPQKLSFIDVVKGIEMFDELHVPTVAVVENMSEFQCEKCDHVNHPFGSGYLNKLKNQFGIKSSIAIPIFTDIARYSDKGSPVVLTLPEEHTICKLYHELGNSVEEEINKLAEPETPHVRYETGTSLIVVREPNGTEKKIRPLELRKKCLCAECIDELSGKALTKESDIRVDVFPAKIEVKGNYAVGIAWSDGHRSSIYPYKRLLSDEIPRYNVS